MTITLRKTRSSAARAAGSARDVIEDVLLNVRKLPRSVDRPRIVSAMEAALNALHHLAQSKLRDNPATSHPIFWGPFVLIGDGAQTLNAQSATAGGGKAATGEL